MKPKITLTVFEITLALLLIFGAPSSRGDDSRTSESIPVSHRVCAKLEALFQEYYPEATFDNQHINGVHFDHKVTTFRFPFTGRKGAMHETEKQRGPTKGGILCNVYSSPGPYRGQLALSPATEGKVAQHVIDRKSSKQLLMAPYSRKSDVHMWVALSYPPDSDAMAWT